MVNVARIFDLKNPVNQGVNKRQITKMVELAGISVAKVFHLVISPACHFPEPLQLPTLKWIATAWKTKSKESAYPSLLNRFTVFHLYLFRH